MRCTPPLPQGLSWQAVQRPAHLLAIDRGEPAVFDGQMQRLRLALHKARFLRHILPHQQLHRQEAQRKKSV